MPACCGMQRNCQLRLIATAQGCSILGSQRASSEASRCGPTASQPSLYGKTQYSLLSLTTSPPMVLFGDKARLRLEPQSPLNLGHFCPNLGKEQHGDVKSPHDPSSDTTFEGRVYLTVLGSAPRSVPTLSVNLVCRQNVFIRGRFNAYELYNHTVHLDTSAQAQGGSRWMPGEHA